MSATNTIDWNKIKAVIFDVDGTLYDQSKLRRHMLRELFTYYSIRPHKISELLILLHFRKQRRNNAAHSEGDLENKQYQWCAAKGFPEAKVRSTIGRWIFTKPNPYLASSMYGRVKDFFRSLKDKRIRTAVFSDYRADEKLVAMELQADLIVAATDPQVDLFKPNPKGLLYIAQQFNVSVEECVFIGDRTELDGECAKRAGMKYLEVTKENKERFYSDLLEALSAKDPK